jgi:CheY-like chemotaxis protein
MGLAMVSALAENLGGALSVHSQPGEGTRVTVRLPAVDDGLAVAGKDAATDAPMPLSILVVDDDPRAMRSLVAQLDLLGHAVRTAPDGVGALAMLRDTTFDVLITDCSMPNLNGRQLVALARSMCPTMPVIMVTGFGDVIRDIEGDLPGVKTILTKPPSLSVLRDALRGVSYGASVR